MDKIVLTKVVPVSVELQGDDIRLITEAMLGKKRLHESYVNKKPCDDILIWRLERLINIFQDIELSQ